jgi:hypothetical protein
LDNHAQRKIPPKQETAEIIGKASIAKIPISARRTGSIERITCAKHCNRIHQLSNRKSATCGALVHALAVTDWAPNHAPTAKRHWPEKSVFRPMSNSVLEDRRL